MAQYIGDHKIIENAGKLLRADKAMLDFYLENHCDTIFPWLLQIEGSSISFLVLHLTAPGLYAHLPRIKNSLPASISDLENHVPDFLTDLLTFKSSYVLFVANKLKESINNQLSIKSSLGETIPKSLSEVTYWTRPTFYTPPKGNEAKIPLNLYGIQPSGDILGRLLKASFDGRESTKYPNPKEVCEYGWYED